MDDDDTFAYVLFFWALIFSISGMWITASLLYFITALYINLTNF